MFNDRDDFLSRASETRAVGLAIMNLIDSINERIIVEYDGSNGILTLRRTICCFGSVVLFSLDPK